jgi:hypothetical protein
MLLLLSLGCSFGLIPSSGKVEVVTTATRIDSIAPAFGPPTGGTAVTLEGEGFSGDVTVTFGGVFGVNPTVTDGTITVTTPALGLSQVVDVVVETDTGSDTLPGGFEFRRRGSGGDSGGGGGGGGGGDSGVVGDADRDTDTVPTYAGMVGGTATYTFVDHACPTCFGLAWGARPVATGTAMLHAPADGSWLSWVPAVGACLTGVSANTLAATTRDVGTSVVLNDGSRDVTFTGTSGSGGMTYSTGALTSAEYTAGGSWALGASGGADVAAFTLPVALRTPADFTSIEPSTLLTEPSNAAFSTHFGESGGTAVTWAPSGDGDFVLIILEASNGSTALGTTTCRSSDDGSFVVPADAANIWPSAARVAVRIQRWSVTETVLPDGSTFEGIGITERVGTGSVYY